MALNIFRCFTQHIETAIPGMSWMPPSNSPQRRENQSTSPPFGGIEGGLSAKPGIADVETFCPTHRDLLLNTSRPFAQHVETFYSTRRDLLPNTSRPFTQHIETFLPTHRDLLPNTSRPFCQHIETFLPTHRNVILLRRSIPAAKAASCGKPHLWPSGCHRRGGDRAKRPATVACSSQA